VSGDAVAWVADALVLLGLVVMTIGVYGLRRMPDVYTQLHATSKAVFLGVIAILAASILGGEPAIGYRALLIGAFLLLTTPLSAHAIARAAYLLREPMRTPGALDESGRALATPARAAATGEPGERRSQVRTIVVGYDGSEPAQRALERAAALAGEEGSVTLVTAVSILPASPGAAPGGGDELEEQKRVLQDGGARLAELGVDVRLVEALADPAQAIIDAARRLDADLIVVGTRGRNVAARVLQGSVSTRVVHGAPCDVLVVR
jgi:multicomponent Na+:H+ antiporter subunit G